jgi:hypothetical protein
MPEIYPGLTRVQYWIISIMVLLLQVATGTQTVQAGVALNQSDDGDFIS